MNAAPPRRTLLILPALAVVLLFLGSLVGPSSSTETRYCAMAREMAVSGDWVVPTFNGAPLLEKPPFEYWGTATSFLLLGVNDVAPRVPHLLAAALVLLVAATVARRLAPEGDAGRWRGRFAAIALGTMPSFVLQAYTIAPDIWLLLSTTAAGWAVLEADRAPGRVPLRWALLLHASLGFGMLVKGPLTLALVLGASIVTAILRRRARILRPFGSPVGLLVFVALTVPWYLALDARLPGMIRSLIERRLFGGMASSADFHAHGPWTVWLPLLGAFPWLATLPGALRGLSSRARFRDGPGLPILAMALAAPVLFSFSASRLPSYPSPAYPWIAILLAIGVPAPAADDAAPGARRVRLELARATIGMATLSTLLAIASVAIAAGAFSLRMPWPFAVGAAVAAAFAAAAALSPRARATFSSLVPRAAVVAAAFVACLGSIAAADPSRVGAVHELWDVLKRHRAPGEPYAVNLNYNGDWGVFPWNARGEVLFFGYPSKPMMVAPEVHRPDLFRPDEELEDWLRGPGRRWLMLRPRDRRRLIAEGLPLTVVASVFEYELVTTKPPATDPPR